MAERAWEGFIAIEGQETGDDRTFAEGALRWETPIPLNRSHEADAPTVGTIEVIERLDGGLIYGRGVFFDSEEGREAAAECERHTARGMDHGVSVDLDDASMELRVRQSVMEAEGGLVDALMGEIIDGDERNKAQEADENGRIKIAESKSGDYMTVFTDARIRAASMVSIPAFADASIRLMNTDESPSVDAPVEDELAADIAELSAELDDPAAIEALSLVAGGYPVAPPAVWFADPAFTAATPLTIDDDGRIYGHGATWGTFHIAFAGQRVEPPRSMTDYAYFRTGAIRTAEGSDLPIGRITMTSGHANGDISALDAMAHYDNTAAVVADVVCGEDEFGIWVSGALRPNVTDEQVRELRAAPLSGDWREIRGNLELVALLAVNTAGFPIPRMSALVSSGEVRSLVASASFDKATEGCGAGTCGCAQPELSREEQIALRELLAERNSAASGTDQASAETVVSEDRLQRAAAAKRKFRAEQARLRFKK